MSISSSLYAGYSNAVKDKWIAKLQTALNKQDWELVSKLVEEMKNFYFTE